jgi:hypothetical protein
MHCCERTIEKLQRCDEQHRIDRRVAERQPMRITEDRGDPRMPSSHFGQHRRRPVKPKYPERGR